jgi:hypothetical protein
MIVVLLQLDYGWVFPIEIFTKGYGQAFNPIELIDEDSRSRPSRTFQGLFASIHNQIVYILNITQCPLSSGVVSVRTGDHFSWKRNSTKISV